jgi:AP2-associated kinase
MGHGDGLEEIEILEIIGEVTCGLLHMHLMEPPIIHRDLKLENILKGGDGKWKICDFGSSTTNQYKLINNVNRDLI